MGGVFAKNTSQRGKFSLKTGIFRKYSSQTWYICILLTYVYQKRCHWKFKTIIYILNKDKFCRMLVRSPQHQQQNHRIRQLSWLERETTHKFKEQERHPHRYTDIYHNQHKVQTVNQHYVFRYFKAKQKICLFLVIYW